MNDASDVNVLFVEDSPDDVELSLRSLRADGIAPQWRRVDSADDLRRALSGPTPDAILSDFSMPGFDGLDAFRISRELKTQIPFIFLSGAHREERAPPAIPPRAT